MTTLPWPAVETICRKLAHRSFADTPALGHDDLVQEALIAVWRASGGENGTDADPPLVWTIARRQMIDAVRVERRHRAVPLPDTLATPPIDHDTRLDLAAALAALPPLDALCVRESGGYGGAVALAARLGVSKGRVMQRRARGLARLRGLVA